MKPANDNDENMIELVVIEGKMTDELFTIDLHHEGETTWNVTRMMHDAMRGTIGGNKVEELPMDWVPPPNYENLNRQKIDAIKKDPFLFNLPVLLLAHADNAPGKPNFKCFADGSHRVTARQEMKMPSFYAFVISDAEERKYRTMKTYRVKP